METAITTTSRQLPATTYDGLLNQDEKYFVKAEKEYTIRQYEELKIEDKNAGYSGADLARYKIANALVIVFEMVGLKKESRPSRELGQKITKYIQDTFPFIAPDELITAVEFGLQGKYNNLNSDGKSIFEHYGIMDLPYINTFMQLYVRFRYEKKVSIAEKIEKSDKPTKEEVIEQLLKDDKAVKDMLLIAYDLYMATTPEKVTWLRDHWFYWLVDLGLVKYDREKMNERFRSIKKKTRWDKWTSQDCVHAVCVEKIYEFFMRTKNRADLEEIFKNVTYINPETYAKLGTVKKV